MIGILTIPGSKGYSGASDSILPESVSPGQGRSFGHIQEGKRDFLYVRVVGGLVDCEVELGRMHPGDSCVIGAIEGFGFAKLEFSILCGRRH